MVHLIQNHYYLKPLAKIKENISCQVFWLVRLQSQIWYVDKTYIFRYSLSTQTWKITDTQTHMHTHTHTQTLTHTHICTACPQAWTTCPLQHIRRNTHRHTNTHARTHIHKYRHFYKCMGTYTRNLENNILYISIHDQIHRGMQELSLFVPFFIDSTYGIGWCRIKFRKHSVKWLLLIFRIVSVP